jgi:hypothetical protein
VATMIQLRVFTTVCSRFVMQQGRVRKTADYTVSLVPARVSHSNAAMRPVTGLRRWE